MASTKSFDVYVAARTRAADHLLSNKDLLALYEAAGGLADDLKEIRLLGQQAEALSQTRSGAKAESGGATLVVLQQFAAVQKEYSEVMAVVQVVRLDLEKAKAPVELLKTLDQILVNEATTIIRPQPASAATEGTPSVKRVARRSVSQESLRAEIQRDAAALLDLKPAHALLAKRKVTAARLKQLFLDAQALAKHLGSRTAKKGEGKAATQALYDTVDEQRKVWTACSRLLGIVAAQDERVRQLLTETIRRPKKSAPKKSAPKKK